MISSTKTPICKLCMQVSLRPSLSTIISNNQLCPNCLNAFQVDFFARKVEGVKVLSLYLYEENFKGALYRYKGQGDIELSNVFLANYLWYLKIKYYGYILVPAPSKEESDEKRGFNHVIEVFKMVNVAFIECIKKKDDFKQSELHFDERQNVIDKLEVVKGERVRGKKILLVDDLFTTGATVKAMIKLLKPYNPKKIQVLTLAYTKISDHHAPSGQD